MKTTESEEYCCIPQMCLAYSAHYGHYFFLCTSWGDPLHLFQRFLLWRFRPFSSSCCALASSDQWTSAVFVTSLIPWIVSPCWSVREAFSMVGSWALLCEGLLWPNIRLTSSNAIVSWGPDIGDKTGVVMRVSSIRITHQRFGFTFYSILATELATLAVACRN